MRKRVAVTTGATLVALACVLSGAAVATAAPGSGAVSRGPATRLAGGAARQWPARTVLAEPLSLGITNQAVDPAAGADYVLATAGQAFRLRRMPLSGAFVKVGPTFPVNGIGLGAGSVWVFGARSAGHGSLRLVLYQVNRSSLAVTRSWRLSGAQRRSGFVAVAPGGGGTEWVGFLRTVLRINARSGAIVAKIRLRSGLTVSDVAVDPAGRHLYVAANTEAGGSAVVEFATASLRELASNSGGDLRFSVGGASATAVPGGVWVSFRTGMRGETVLLRQVGLRTVKLPGAGQPGSLFHWVMFASTEFAGRSLFLARQDGIIACLNPRTGAVRSRGRVAGLVGAGQLLASGPRGRPLYGLAPAALIAITAPAACQA